MLFIVLVENACVYTSSISFDWILDSGASHCVAPCKDSFVAYNPGGYVKCLWGIIMFAVLLEWEMSRLR